MKKIVEQEILDIVTQLEERKQRVWVMRSYSPKNPLVWYWRWVKRKFRRHPLIVIWESILALIVLTALMLAVFYVIGVVLIGKT